MANTMELIASYTVPSSAASYTFASIPQTFTDLKLVYSARSDYAASGNAVTNMTIQPNASGTLTGKAAGGNGSVTYSITTALPILNSSSATANVFSNGEIYIPNYTSANNKSMSVDAVIENNATSSWAEIAGYLWAYTNAITSIYLAPTASGNFVTGTTFYLYGIKNS